MAEKVSFGETAERGSRFSKSRRCCLMSLLTMNEELTLCEAAVNTPQLSARWRCKWLLCSCDGQCYEST